MRAILSRVERNLKKREKDRERSQKQNNKQKKMTHCPSPFTGHLPTRKPKKKEEKRGTKVVESQ